MKICYIIHYDLSVLSMPVVDLQKYSLDSGGLDGWVGGWVG